VKIVALLSWYDEQPEWLHAAITSLHHLPTPVHVVAVDGAYADYPKGTARSNLDQYQAIHEATVAIDAGLTIHTPTSTWHGQECEKRTRLFRLGDHAAQPGDWFLILDADERITSCPPDLPARLTTTFDVADVTFREPGPLGPKTYPIPILFRAIPGITVTGNHYTYRTPDGRNLWGNAHTTRLEPRVDVTELTVDHLTGQRPPARREAAKTYYRTRDAAGYERGTCHHCRERPATRTIPGAWTRLHTGDFVADWTDVCEQCAPGRLEHGKRQLRLLGISDPDRAPLYDMPGANPVSC
jgi:hypothetical protein